MPSQSGISTAKWTEGTPDGISDIGRMNLYLPIRNWSCCLFSSGPRSKNPRPAPSRTTL
jgi:hypothetical protein